MKQIQAKAPLAFGAGLGLVAYVKGYNMLSEKSDYMSDNPLLANAIGAIAGVALAVYAGKNQFLQGAGLGIAGGAVLSIANGTVFKDEPIELPAVGGLPLLNSGGGYDASASFAGIPLFDQGEEEMADNRVAQF